MNANLMTLNELNHTVMRALCKEVGLAGAVRFLHQFDAGLGDYTKERHDWLPDDVDKICRDIKRQRKKQQ